MAGAWISTAARTSSMCASRCAASASSAAFSRSSSARASSTELTTFTSFPFAYPPRAASASARSLRSRSAFSVCAGTAPFFALALLRLGGGALAAPNKFAAGQRDDGSAADATGGDRRDRAAIEFEIALLY